MHCKEGDRYQHRLSIAADSGLIILRAVVSSFLLKRYFGAFDQSLLEGNHGFFSLLAIDCRSAGKDSYDRYGYCFLAG
jgi:hypothetical protein